MDRKLYDVWIEGYMATGEHGIAQYLGSSSADSFPQACQYVLQAKEWDMKYYDQERNTYWACRFFDNETDARKSYG